SSDGDFSENMAKADMSALVKAFSGSPLRGSGMAAKLLRTKRKRASAERYLRSLGATIDMANLIRRPSKGSSQRRIIAWMFTKSQLGGRRGYWVWPLSGNCCCRYKSA